MAVAEMVPLLHWKRASPMLGLVTSEMLYALPLLIFTLDGAFAVQLNPPTVQLNVWPAVMLQPLFTHVALLGEPERTPWLHAYVAVPVVGAVLSVHDWLAPWFTNAVVPKAGPLQVLPPTVQLRVVPTGISQRVLQLAPALAVADITPLVQVKVAEPVLG